MAVIPAWLVRSNLDDPRKMPYLLVWKSKHGGEIKEAVRLARYVEPSKSRVTDDYVELKRTDGSATALRVFSSPANAAALGFCSLLDTC